MKFISAVATALALLFLTAFVFQPGWARGHEAEFAGAAWGLLPLSILLVAPYLFGWAPHAVAMRRLRWFEFGSPLQMLVLSIWIGWVALPRLLDLAAGYLPPVFRDVVDGVLLLAFAGLLVALMVNRSRRLMRTRYGLAGPLRPEADRGEPG